MLTALGQNPAKGSAFLTNSLGWRQRTSESGCGCVAAKRGAKPVRRGEHQEQVTGLHSPLWSGCIQNSPTAGKAERTPVILFVQLRRALLMSVFNAHGHLPVHLETCTGSSTSTRGRTFFRAMVAEPWNRCPGRQWSVPL